MIRDHYVVLGVSRIESDTGIQAAFRALVKRYHPDVAGGVTAPLLREVLEAYEVLSDPDRRRSYDESLESGDRRGSIAVAATPRPFVAQPEPLIPETVSIANDFDAIRPSREDLFQRFRRNFIGGPAKGDRLEALNVVVLVPAEKARRGGLLSVGVPVFHPCPFCRGTGRDWLSHCFQCAGRGEIQSEQTVRVRVPPFAGPRATIDVPLLDIGIGNMFLRLQLQVAT